VIVAGENGKCPHCGIANKFEVVSVGREQKQYGRFDTSYLTIVDETDDNINSLITIRCGNNFCRNVILFYKSRMIYPLGGKRPTAPSEVQPDVAGDYADACLVESLSAKAAAALARRCLQNMLRGQGFTRADLNDQIEDAIKVLPTDLADHIDTIRVVGNFAAHPNKSQNTGEIVDVEPGEAEYSLDIIYELFDHYYVRPARLKANKAALQSKLKAAGSEVVIK